MDQLLTIQDGLIKITNLHLSKTSGAVYHTGSFSLAGDAVINGVLTVNTIKAKTIESESGGLTTDVGNWVGNTEAEINGVGLQWTWGRGSTQLIYRNGNRLYTNANIDIHASSTYNIDNVAVLSLSELGPTVQTSHLTKVGTLSTLEVADDANIGGFAFFNSTFGRLGLGNEEPALAIDIVENNVNLIAGSPDTNLAVIGTASNHNVGIITDNITRILVKNNGEVVIGDAAGKNGVLRIHGSLYADNVVTDSRIDRSSPLVFQATKSQAVYGLGLTWAGTGPTKQFIMLEGPDRLWTTENFDVGLDKAYYINGQPVLSNTALGNSITESNLSTLGVLQKLVVSGKTDLHGAVTVTGGALAADTIFSNNISSNETISISAQSLNVISGDRNSIEIGTKTHTRTPVKVFGTLSVGINNPDPTVNFSVHGDIKVADRRFTNGTAQPTQGSYEVGDICWNTVPQKGSYIGWVCVSSGNPGVWAPFGEIK